LIFAAVARLWSKRMEFWSLPHPDDAPFAINDRDGTHWNYKDLHTDAARIQAALPSLGQKSLGLLTAQICYEGVAAYLAALSGAALRHRGCLLRSRRSDDGQRAGVSIRFMRSYAKPLSYRRLR
jgi:hypothetical protein